MNNPFFSIIVPTYNRSKFISEAIESILSQTFKNYEILIIDDASTDDTKQKIQKFNNKKIIYIKNKKNQGVAYSRNIGIKNANSNWIAFLDSDDLWGKNKLQKQYEAIINNSDISIFHTNEKWLKNNIEINQKKYQQKHGGNIFESSLYRCMMGPSSAIIKKDLFYKIDFFNENFPACEDYDLWLKLSIFHNTNYIKEPLVIKRAGDYKQLSSDIKFQDKYRILSLIDIYTKYKFDLTKKQINLLIKVLIKKIDIFYDGAKKHNNLENMNFAENIKQKTYNIL